MNIELNENRIKIYALKNLEGYKENPNDEYDVSFGLEEVVLDDDNEIVSKIYAFRNYTKISYMRNKK